MLLPLLQQLLPLVVEVCNLKLNLKCSLLTLDLFLVLGAKVDQLDKLLWVCAELEELSHFVDLLADLDLHLVSGVDVAETTFVVKWVKCLNLLEVIESGVALQSNCLNRPVVDFIIQPKALAICHFSEKILQIIVVRLFFELEIAAIIHELTKLLGAVVGQDIDSNALLHFFDFLVLLALGSAVQILPR